MCNKTKGKITSLNRYKNKELIEGIGWALDLAIQGKITGACLIIKESRFNQTVMILGTHAEDPLCAMRGVRKLKKEIKEEAKQLEKHGTITQHY